MLMYSKGRMNYGNYGFRFLEAISLPIAQIDSVGSENRMSTEYYFDGMNRLEQDRFLFQYTLSGWGVFEMDGATYRVEKGQAFVAQIPGSHVYYLPRESQGWEFIYIMLYGSEVAARWSEITKATAIVSQFAIDSELIRYLFHIYREAEGANITDGFQASGLAFGFLMELLRSIKNNNREKYSELIMQGIKIMQVGFDKVYGIEEVAIKLGISKYHFTREFTKATGISPGKWLTKLKIEKSVQLLHQSNLSIDDIAKEVGYSNGNYFIKVFGQYLGVSPGVFRSTGRIQPYTHLKL